MLQVFPWNMAQRNYKIARSSQGLAECWIAVQGAPGQNQAMGRLRVLLSETHKGLDEGANILPWRKCTYKAEVRMALRKPLTCLLFLTRIQRSKRLCRGIVRDRYFICGNPIGLEDVVFGFL
jgi:hypothetical protein